MHFEHLDREQQEQAIRRLAADGMSEHSIARATRLSVEQVRRVLAAEPRT
jgi:ABC-type phosphate/phosphonate transport system ATPase subunit